jgi:hypothetical protein
MKLVPSQEGPRGESDSMAHLSPSLSLTLTQLPSDSPPWTQEFGEGGGGGGGGGGGEKGAVCACMRACVRVCVCAGGRACVRAHLLKFFLGTQNAVP